MTIRNNSLPRFSAIVFAVRVTRGVSALSTLAASCLDPTLRGLLPDIQSLRSSLPQRYEGRPLPQFLAELTPQTADLAAQVDVRRLRTLVDAIARLDRRSPFGLCLRRALLRYHFLRRAGVDLEIVFGVRFRQPQEGPGVAGHAWNTLDGEPYHERVEDYQGFTAIYRYPEPPQT